MCARAGILLRVAVSGVVVEADDEDGGWWVAMQEIGGWWQ